MQSAIPSPAKPRQEMLFCIVMLWHTMKLSCMSISKASRYQKSLSRSPGSATSVLLPASIIVQCWCVLPLCRVCSFLGNLAGALFVVFLLFETKIFVHEAEDGMNFAKSTAILKTSSDFGATVVKGILANWLVSPAFLTRCM